MLSQKTLLFRSYERDLSDPGYAVTSGKTRHWSNALHGRLPRSPDEFRMLLDPNNPLRFNLLSYGDTYDDCRDFRIALQHSFQNTLDHSHTNMVMPKGRLGFSAIDARQFCRILSFLDTSDCISYQGYYLGAVMYRQRPSRDELLFIFGFFNDPQIYRVVRLRGLEGDLHFRIHPCTPSQASIHHNKNRICAVDFHLEKSRQDPPLEEASQDSLLPSIAAVRIREIRRLRPSHDGSYQLCNCNDLLFNKLHKGHLAGRRRQNDPEYWVLPVEEFHGIYFHEV